jgi:hypothetical protein
MTVSPSHSINLAGLNKALTDLGLSRGPGPVQPCTLYFVVPPDVYPVYQHKIGCMVPSGSALPANVTLAVLEIPLTAALALPVAGTTAASGSKRKAEDADTIAPVAKKAIDTTCNCTTGCKSGHCKCLKHSNKCGSKCHTAAAPASAAACSNR